MFDKLTNSEENMFSTLGQQAPLSKAHIQITQRLDLMIFTEYVPRVQKLCQVGYDTGP